MIKTIINKLKDCLPYICPACHQEQMGGGLCAVCQGYLQPIEHACPSCSKPDSFNTLCGQCLKRPLRWDAAHIEWHFEGLTRHLIHRFKYHHDISAGRALTDIWLANNPHLFKPENLIAVPMFHKKEHKKGFNHATWIAKRLSNQWQIPIWDGIKRVRDTEALEGLTKKQRKITLKNAFQLNKKPPKSVAIVDDVFTSGTTAAELTRLLKRNGTQVVTVWALARTPLLST